MLTRHASVPMRVAIPLSGIAYILYGLIQTTESFSPGNADDAYHVLSWMLRIGFVFSGVLTLVGWFTGDPITRAVSSALAFGLLFFFTLAAISGGSPVTIVLLTHLLALQTAVMLDGPSRLRVRRE